MSEKPFWAGKTLMEIQNLDKRVKVTMENGDVFIGKLVRRSRDTDGICSLSMQLDAHRTYLHVFSAESSDTQPHHSQLRRYRRIVGRKDGLMRVHRPRLQNQTEGDNQ